LFTEETMSNAPKNPDTPASSVKIAVAVVVGLLVVGTAVFVVVQRNATSLGGGPGFLGTRAGLFADLNLLAEIVLLVGLLVGYGFARRGNIPAHQYNQTAWVLFNIVLTVFIMAVVFSRQVTPGIPEKLGEAYTLTSTLHAVLGTVTILCGIYILLRMNKLLPKALRVSWWKNLMRVTLGLYWLTGLFGLGTYYVWYIRALPTVDVPTPEATQVGGLQPGGQVTVPLANYSFVPAELTIPAGTTVLFENLDPDAHTVTFDNTEFPALGFQSGDSGEIKFDSVGAFQFYCEYHGAPGLSGMSGVVRVVEASANVAVPTAVVPPTVTPPPTAIPFDVLVLSVNGAGVFRDVAARNDGFLLSLAGIPAEISGELHVWLTGEGEPLRLGALIRDAQGQAQFTYADADARNLLAEYSGFLVTAETPGAQPAAPSDQVVLGGRIVQNVLGPARLLLASAPDTPDNQGYAARLLDQVEELTHHVEEINANALSGDRVSMNRHIEHMYAIISGKGSENYIDFDGDQFVDDPGDGFGILNYADAITTQALAAAAAPDATDNVRTQAEHLALLAGNIRTWAKRMLDLGLGAHEARTDEDRQAHTAELPALAERMLSGFDADGNSLIEPIAGEGGAYTIYFQSQALAAMGALTEEALFGLPTPAPPTATPRPEDTPIPTPTVGPTATPGPVTVIYRNFEIVPNNIVIKVGTTIIFLIKDALHEPYTFDDAPAFDSGPNLGDGSTYQRTFDNTGAFTILCGYHANMSATLTVTP
jgi:plastocyanin/uncharacterized membrane protein YozB (DUF420 family)